MKDTIKPIGTINLIIDYKDGKPSEFIDFKNTILRNGRIALAKSLSNKFGTTYDFFVSRMLFGDGGTSGGIPKTVTSERTGLFGTTRVNKPIISSLDSNTPGLSIFTSIITYDEANGYALNEMGLLMNNAELYSMATFPDLNKTDNMQLTWNWNVLFS